MRQSDVAKISSKDVEVIEGYCVVVFWTDKTWNEAETEHFRQTL